MTVSGHPYFPVDLHVPDYVPLEADYVYILGVFFSSVAVVFGITWMLSGRHKRQLTTTERVLCCWFMITGLIHMIFEGWVVARADFFKHPSGNFLSDTWKEYAKADSRYVSRDAFTISMEAVTAFLWGPLCPLLVWSIFNAKPWRYSLMIIVSAGQIYGTVLYYGTCVLEDFKHSRPEPIYFWFYFVIVNSMWILIPGLCILHAWTKISSAVGSTKPRAKRA